MDTQIARTNMLKQQLRTSGVVQETLLSLFNTTPRELFVPADYKKMAYADMSIPLPHQQTMFTPMMEALILKELAIQPHERVLEIGTGTGFFTALLAQLAQHVTSVDIFPEFIEGAADNLARLQLHNIALHTGNGAQGWKKNQPFDVIILSGALPFIPIEFQQQLMLGGRLFAVIGTRPTQQAHRMTRISHEEWQDTFLFETDLPGLIDAPEREAFVF